MLACAYPTSSRQYSKLNYNITIISCALNKLHWLSDSVLHNYCPDCHASLRGVTKKPHFPCGSIFLQTAMRLLEGLEIYFKLRLSVGQISFAYAKEKNYNEACSNLLLLVVSGIFSKVFGILESGII
jgi:hypothetical protein